MHYLQRGSILDAANAEAIRTVIIVYAGVEAGKIQVTARVATYRTTPVVAAVGCAEKHTIVVVSIASQGKLQERG